MNRIRTKLLTTTGLALTLWACTEGGQRLADSPLAPAHSTSTVELRKLRGNDGSLGIASGIFDSNGGRLELAGHVLQVPKGAVDGPTTFTLALAEADYITVVLTATVTLSTGEVVNVGEKGFAVPVQLHLSYKDGSESVDASQLKVVWEKSDGSLEPMPSEVDLVGKRVRADLAHFSGYTIATPQ